jgi:hypothetical protein
MSLYCRSPARYFPVFCYCYILARSRVLIPPPWQSWLSARWSSSAVWFALRPWLSRKKELWGNYRKTHDTNQDMVHKVHLACSYGRSFKPAKRKGKTMKTNTAVLIKRALAVVLFLVFSALCGYGLHFYMYQSGTGPSAAKLFLVTIWAFQCYGVFRMWKLADSRAET